VPKVTSNLSITNGSFGAIAAISQSQDDLSFVPKLAYELVIWNGCYLEAVIEIRTSNAYFVL
jgi:hypothetical protein